MKPKNPNTFTSSQRGMLMCRGMDPKNYRFVKETYCSFYVRDIRTGKIMIIFKHN